MQSTTVDGLVSGLNTSQVIAQLMQIERQPQLRLAAKRDAQQKVLDIYKSLNTKFAAIGSAAEALNTQAGWKAATASSSKPELVSASAESTATAGKLTFTVTALAAAHAVVSQGSVADTDTVVASGDFTITDANGTHTIAAGDGKLSTVVANINSAGLGLTANAVKVGDGAYKLQITAATTGAGTSFTVDGTNLAALGGSFDLVAQAADAVIHVGEGGAPGYDVQSATNTFSGVLPGLTFTVLGTTAAPVTVTVANDPDALAEKVQKLVDAANDALKYIKSNATYDQATKKKGALLGDTTVSSLQDSLLRAMSDTVAGKELGAAANVGITLGADGTFTFDKTKFETAYKDDPAAVVDLFERGDLTDTADDGVAERIRVAVKEATDISTGRLTSAINGRTSQIDSYKDQIAAWDVRLELRETALRRQFTSLEVALGKLRDQSNWLAGQLAGLSGSS